MNIMTFLAEASEIVQNQEHIHGVAPADLWQYFASFGLGVVVMALFIWDVRANYKQERKANAEMQEKFVTLARETLQMFNDLSGVVQSIGPLIKGSNDVLKAEITAKLQTLTEHLDTHTELLKEAIKNVRNH